MKTSLCSDCRIGSSTSYPVACKILKLHNSFKPSYTKPCPRGVSSKRHTVQGTHRLRKKRSKTHRSRTQSHGINRTYHSGTYCPWDVLSKMRIVQGTYCPRGVLFKGHILQGAYRPRDLLSKGRIVQGTYCSRDASCKNKRSGHIGRGHLDMAFKPRG